jgi:hypothetical protein
MTAMAAHDVVVPLPATQHPVLVETAAGVIGAIVTEPACPARAAAVLLEGWEGSRAGNDQIWVKVAAGLAELGVVSLRHDYAGIGESMLAPLELRATSTRELVHWFRRYTADLDLLVVATCYGVVPALETATDLGGARAVALITPATGRAAEARLARAPRSRPVGVAATARRARSAVYQRGRRLTTGARRRAARAYARTRYGVEPGPRPIPSDLMAIDTATLASQLVALAPVWVLTGGDDADTATLAELGPELVRTGRYEIEVVDDHLLHASANPAAQAVTAERVLAWARRQLAALDPSALAPAATDAGTVEAGAAGAPSSHGGVPA